MTRPLNQAPLSLNQTHLASRRKWRLPPSLSSLLLQRHRWFTKAVASSLRDAGLDYLTPIRSLALEWLAPEGSRPSGLARRLRVTRQAAHQLVQVLERKGAVALLPHAHDRSAVVVVLTPQGRDAVAQVRWIHQGLEEVLAARLGEESFGRLAAALRDDWGSPLPPYRELR